MELWKTKQTKIYLAAVCIIIVLAAIFILQPGPKKDNTDALSTNNNNNPPTMDNNTPDGSLDAQVNSDNSFSSSNSQSSSSSSSSSSGKDKYETDPVPEGKPKPVEPEDVTVDNNKKYTATISIRCDTILDNMDTFNKDKLGVLPEDGVILAPVIVTFSEGENVFDVLKQVTRDERIHMEFKFTPIYNSAYIQGIHNIYEFDCGGLSGWMYKVNNWFPNYGASRYVLKQGDVIEWVYTCDLGKDVGGGYAIGGQIIE
ncbi:MAG: DUF4430 domain-containing protein [Candidatus Bathyarchaeota archaeon]|nr:DUF4430 domain-containing protein [Candidatus Termiticorpusculum sp.]